MADKDSEKQQTLVTLDQLSQTLDVMSHVVARLKDQLSQQAALKEELLRQHRPVVRDEEERRRQEEGIVVEIATLDMEDPVYH